MNKIRVRRIIGVLLALTMFSLTSCDEEELSYLLQQAPGQIDLLLHRVPIKKILKRDDLDPEVRHKLELVLDVKAYAVHEIGLYRNKNYEIYTEIDRDSVVYTFSACPPLELKPLTWKFPVVGEVPYLGFFDKDKGFKKKAELDEQGYDTLLRRAGAYSMLGIVSDPLYSPLLRMRDADLANLIVHEMLHSTVWVEGEVDFNENLALFVGNQGAINYLIHRDGPQSEEALYAINSDYDDKLFSQYIAGWYKELDELYKSELDDAEKLELKQQIMKASKDKFKNEVLPAMKTGRYKGFSEREYNNALVLSRARYYKDLSLYKKIYAAHNNDLRAMVEFFKAFEQMDTRPEKYARSWLVDQG